MVFLPLAYLPNISEKKRKEKNAIIYPVLHLTCPLIFLFFFSSPTCWQKRNKLSLVKNNLFGQESRDLILVGVPLKRWIGLKKKKKKESKI